MSKSKKINIYQFKITLLGISPKIWRRIQVPESYKFSDLHEAIQNAMGWENSHLHQFSIISPNTGLPTSIGMLDDDWDQDEDLLDEKKIKISKYFSIDNPESQYEYDFGDGWEHQVLLEKILPAEDGVKYPKCITGKNACPPEDCGGVWGYRELVEIMQDPKHPEYQERIEWIGEEFDPKEFTVESIEFSKAKACS
ncbi:MAG: plasmid pRiA4b ORF-3 family protein [Pseudomonadota bacterium]